LNISDMVHGSYGVDGMLVHSNDLL